jgi:hypothetical protein
MANTSLLIRTKRNDDIRTGLESWRTGRSRARDVISSAQKDRAVGCVFFGQLKNYLRLRLDVFERFEKINRPRNKGSDSRSPSCSD